MPVTSTEVPILSQFLCIVTSNRSDPKDAIKDAAMSASHEPVSTPPAGDESRDERPEVKLARDAPKKLPKGVVLGKDGKPYVCTTGTVFLSRLKSKLTNLSVT